MSEWQDISTAPRKGFMLGWWLKGYVIMEWYEPVREFVGDDGSVVSPRLWTPLPPPPNQEGESA